MNYGEDEDEIKKKKVPINVTNANFSRHKVKITTNYSRVCVLVCQRRPFSWGGSLRALVSQPTEVMLLQQQQQQQPTASSAMMSA